MNPTSILSASLLLATLAATAQAADRPAVGTTPPGFTLPSSTGEIFSLPPAELGQKTLLIFFRGTW